VSIRGEPPLRLLEHRAAQLTDIVRKADVIVDASDLRTLY